MSIFNTDPTNPEEVAERMKQEAEEREAERREAEQEQMAELARRAAKKPDADVSPDLISSKDLDFLDFTKDDKDK